MALRSTTFPLSGAVVVVTGGARGIGRATALAFRDTGALVTVGDLDGALVGEVASELGQKAVGTHLDVTKPESFQEFLALAESRLGPVDVLVNNAGIMPLSHLVDEPDEVTRRIVDVNLHGVITGTKLVVPGMLQRRHGHIINIASMGGRVGAAGGATYSASKFGVVGFSEAMRYELRRAGVQVSCVLPTVVTTELSTGVGRLRGLKPVTTEDVAATIVGVAASPRPETWVPRRSKALYLALSMLPYRLRAGGTRALGGLDTLYEPDRTAREAYERRARGDLQREA